MKVAQDQLFVSLLQYFCLNFLCKVLEHFFLLIAGTHGMGQAQSQFSMGDCSECPGTIYGKQLTKRFNELYFNINNT